MCRRKGWKAKKSKANSTSQLGIPQAARTGRRKRETQVSQRMQDYSFVRFLSKEMNKNRSMAG
jgi:hypothetical protein